MTSATSAGPSGSGRPSPSPPRPYLTLAGPVEAEVEAKRSRFRCRLERVDTEDAARAVVEAARREHWDARHHCSAFRIGPPPQVAQRSSDDGEPSGTAGAPILDALGGAGVSDVVAVVTRWFGGTLLGTGGLVRAYGDTTRAALAAAPLVRRVTRRRLHVTVDAVSAGRVEHALRGAGHLVETSYGESGAVLTVAIDPDDVDAVRAHLNALTAGTAVVSTGDLRWVDRPLP